MASPTFFPVGEVGGLLGVLGGLGVVSGRLGNPSPRRPTLAIREAHAGHLRDGVGTPSPGSPLTYGEPPAPSPAWPPTPPPPHQPIEAFGREATPSPRLTDWAKGPPPWSPTPSHWLPRHSPTPQTFGSGGKREGRGRFSRAKGADTMWPALPIPLLGTP